jgi:cytochrome c biogenesis protein CcdA
LRKIKMALSNNQQALVLALSIFFGTIGTAGAAIPNFIPEQYKWVWVTVFWTLSIIGVAFKEVLGGKPSTTPTTEQPTITTTETLTVSYSAWKQVPSTNAPSQMVWIRQVYVGGNFDHVEVATTNPVA